MNEELNRVVGSLPPTQQQQVLDFAKSCTTQPIRGTPGRDLLSFAGCISPDDLALMSEANETALKDTGDSQFYVALKHKFNTMTPWSSEAIP